MTKNVIDCHKTTTIPNQIIFCGKNVSIHCFGQWRQQWVYTINHVDM